MGKIKQKFIQHSITNIRFAYNLIISTYSITTLSGLKGFSYNSDGIEGFYRRYPEVIVFSCSELNYLLLL
jgi:hypothetical protein